MSDLMAGVKKPIAPKAIVAKSRSVAKEKPRTVVYYEVETIKGANRSVDKFE